MPEMVAPRLSIPAAGQKDRGLWGREWDLKKKNSLTHAHTLFNNVSHSELNLARRKGWARNFCYKIEFILALNYHYLQSIIQFIEDKQRQTKKLILLPF